MHTDHRVINIAPARGWQPGDAVALDDDTVFVTIRPWRRMKPTYPEQARLRMSLSHQDGPEQALIMNSRATPIRP